MGNGKGKGKLNYIWYAFAIVVFITVVILDITDSMKTIKEFPQLNIDRDNLFGVNEVNLKDFELEEDGSFYAQSDDPWVYYTLPETTVVKIVEIAVDSVSRQNTSATLHFVLEDGTWEYRYFYIHNGVNRVQFSTGEDLRGVSAIRFDFVNGKDISVKVDNVKINSHYATTLKYHIRSLIILLSIVMFAILPRANKELRNFIRAYLSFLLFIICAGTDSGILSYFFKILSIGMFCLFLFERNGKFTVKFEKVVLLLFGTLFCILMLMRGRLSGEYELLNVLCACSMIIMAITYVANDDNGLKICNWFVRNRLILLVILCFVALSLEVINSWPMWDAYEYSRNVSKIMKSFNADLSGVYNLYLASHTSLGYSLWIILFQLFREGTASIQFADIILAGISIYAYYQILRKVLGKGYSDKLLAIATMPYAFSPFVLGIIGNVNLDSATMYFAIIFIACSLYHYDCLELVFAFLLCNTKETAVIYYVVYVITKIICEYLSDHKLGLRGLIKFGLGNLKNYIYASPVIIWWLLYKSRLSGGWQGASFGENDWNYFGINHNVIVGKIKQIFFLNFNWIFWGIIIGGIFVICIKKIKVDRQKDKIMVPMVTMGLSVIAIGCFYVTYVLARYIVPLIPIIYLMATWMISKYNKKYLETYNIVVSILLLIQCFVTVDPMMNKMFPSWQIGDGQVVYGVDETRPENRLDDAIMYNRQYIYWQEVLVDILEQSGYDGNMLIVFPSGYTQYFILGHWDCTWNVKVGKLEIYDEDAVLSGKNKKIISCSTTSDVYKKLETMGSNRILYIIPGLNGIDTDFVASKQVVRRGEVKYKGYEAQYMVLTIE